MGIFSGIFGKKNEPKADFSDVRSGSSTSAPASGRRYVVVKGDSLSKIAQREYGDMKQWTRIFEANRDIITDPNLIHPGQTLRLP